MSSSPLTRAPAELNDFLKRIEQKAIAIRGTPSKSPLFFRDFVMTASVYLVKTESVLGWLPDASYHLLEALPGRALLALHCLEYLDTDVGPYNEVSLSVAVRTGTQRALSPFEIARSLLGGRFNVFIKDLPVNTEIALAGGLDFFGFPKRMMDISFRETASQRICTLRDPKTLDLVLEVESRKLALKPWRANGFLPALARKKNLELTSYPQIRRDGEKELTTLRANMIAIPSQWNLSVKPWATALRFGNSSAVGDFAVLAQAQLVGSAYAVGCQGVLFEPEDFKWPK